MKIYLVGGAVRDQLLGLPVKERDWVVVGADPDHLLKRGYRQVGRGFPVFLHPETQEEYALARTEKKLGYGYHGFVCDANPAVSLEEDLSRRDLTINAMAMDNHGRIIDPFHGRNDLHHKILRHVSDAFVEDPLRVLRVARFMARFEPLGFQLAAETRELIQKMVRSGELLYLVAERVWQEWQKSLQEKNPVMFITTLRSCGALKVILPELDRLFGIPNPAKDYPEIDAGIHSLRALEVTAELTPDPVVRFASLVHDLDKFNSPMTAWPQHPMKEQLELPQIKQLCQRLSIPNRYQTLAALAGRWLRVLQGIHHASAADILAVFNHTQAFQTTTWLDQLLVIREGDMLSRGFTPITDQHPQYRQANDWRVLLAACQTVTAQPFIAKGLSGVAIKDAMLQARLDCLNRIRSQPE